MSPKMPPINTATTTATTSAPPPQTATISSSPIADQLATSQARVRALEAQLAEARDALTERAATAALRLDYPLLSPEAAAPMVGARMHFTFWEGPVGAQRKARFWSLYQGLERSHAKLADGTPVHEACHTVLWLLDHMRLADET
jgi:hypothetical protein